MRSNERLRGKWEIFVLGGHQLEHFFPGDTVCGLREHEYGGGICNYPMSKWSEGSVDIAKSCKRRASVLSAARWPIRPQIRMKVDRISKSGPSNPQKRYIDLTNFGPQISKIADTKHQELPGSFPQASVVIITVTLRYVFLTISCY